MTKGIIFDIQRFSLHDGPGIRTTVFLKGCPLRCSWCHNPESQDMHPQIGVLIERCTECGECVKVCPQGSIHLDRAERIERSRCRYCGACVRACPQQALERIGREITSGEVVEESKKDKLFFDQSGGGVTLSGGEPLFQYEFTLETARLLKKNFLHVVIDTCGYGGGGNTQNELIDLASIADLILYDLKIIDACTHLQHTGIPSKMILENARFLTREFPQKTLFRYPLVPGINDTTESLEKLKGFLHTLGAVKLELLAYHRLGASKYRKINKPWEMEHISSMDNTEVEKVKGELSKSLPKVEFL